MLFIPLCSVGAVFVDATTIMTSDSPQADLFNNQECQILGRTTSWSPKSQCVYGPENEIAAVTFFAKTSTALTNRSAFASQCLQPRLHVAHLCQSTMLFGIVWVLLSQAFAAWRGWGADSAATLLAGCFFLRLRWQWIVLSRLGVAPLSFVLVFWCVVCFWTPLPFALLLTHATRRALCTLAGTWEQIRTKILRAFGGMMGGPLVATCLGTPSNSIKYPESPLDKKKFKRLVSAIETENLNNLKTAVHLVNCIVNWKPQKLQKSQTPCQRDWNWKLQKSQNSILRFLAESGRHIKLFDLFDARFWVGNVYRFWTPKGGPPQFSTWMFVSSFLAFVVSLFWWTFEAAGGVLSVMSQSQNQGCHTLQRVDLARPFLVSPAIKIEIVKKRRAQICGQI